MIVKNVSQLGCVSQDLDALVSQGTKEFRRDPMQKVLNAIRKVRITKSTPGQASIQEKKGPSLGKTIIKHPRQRRPYAPKFEDRSHLAKNIYKLKENDRATFFSLAEKWVLLQRSWVLPSASSRESCKREFVVDSGASMNMVSKTLTRLSWRP